MEERHRWAKRDFASVSSFSSRFKFASVSRNSGVLGNNVIFTSEGGVWDYSLKVCFIRILRLKFTNVKEYLKGKPEADILKETWFFGLEICKCNMSDTHNISATSYVCHIRLLCLWKSLGFINLWISVLWSKTGALRDSGSSRCNGNPREIALAEF